MEKKRFMRSLVVDNLRQLVTAVNEAGIEQEDIVFLEKSGEQMVLIYFS